MTNVVPIRSRDAKCDTTHCQECGYELPGRAAIITQVSLPLILRIQCPGCKELIFWTLEEDSKT